VAYTDINQVRASLKVWGIFWAEKEFGSGYGSTSSTAKICDMLKTQVYASSDLHLFSHLSDSIFEPQHIEEVGLAVEKLSFKCRDELKKKYIKFQELDNYHTREGENSLMGML
jgi:hypothetical protein